MLKNGKIHFFTGKGGVGKSTLSVAFARELASQGYKTLWLEFSQTPTYKNISEAELGFKPTPLGSNLDVASWNGEDCLQEFVRHSVKLRLIYETFYRSKAISALIKAAPALREIAFLGYLTSHLRGVEPCLDYDQVVVDAPSTGHFLAGLKVPEALLDISSHGPMGFHCNGILKVLRDQSLTTIYSVFLAEPLVVIEHEYLQQELKKLGLFSHPWMNKALDDSMINELKKLLPLDPPSIFAEQLLNQKLQQDQIVKKFNTEDLVITSDADLDSLKKQLTSIVKGLK